jgi:hypothetical protein
VDPHVHLLPAGLLLQRLMLDSGIDSPGEFTARVARYSSGLAPEQWVLGGGWDDNQWGGQLPNASWIDEVRGPPAARAPAVAALLPGAGRAGAAVTPHRPHLPLRRPRPAGQRC